MATPRQPKLVIGVYDNGGKTFDRYTVALDLPGDRRDKRMKECIGLSSNPSHPQGFSQFATCQLGRHLGKKLKWGQLPAEIRKHVAARLK